MKQKVYIVLEIHADGATDCKGVYSTPELAIKRVENFLESQKIVPVSKTNDGNDWTFTINDLDEIVIEEYVLDYPLR